MLCAFSTASERGVNTSACVAILQYSHAFPSATLPSVTPLLPWLLLLAQPPALEFYGYGGLDIDRIRATITSSHPSGIRAQLQQHFRLDPTDIASICCDSNGQSRLFIGLPGSTSQNLPAYPSPTGNVRLPTTLLNLNTRLDKAIEAAVRAGGDAAREDDSTGYALLQHPPTRALQLKMHRWANNNVSLLRRVLTTSSSTQHRRLAADALSYASTSPPQRQALIQAALDPDPGVRNNATRALAVLLRAFPHLALEIPASPFVDMLNSGIWTDRNKAASLFAELTKSASPALLAELRSRALLSLLEMARWRDPSHAWFSRIILARLAGIPADRLPDLTQLSSVETIAALLTP